MTKYTVTLEIETTLPERDARSILNAAGRRAQRCFYMEGEEGAEEDQMRGFFQGAEPSEHAEICGQRVCQVSHGRGLEITSIKFENGVTLTTGMVQ
jgi:hypothetical protein